MTCSLVVEHCMAHACNRCSGARRVGGESAPLPAGGRTALGFIQALSTPTAVCPRNAVVPLNRCQPGVSRQRISARSSAQNGAPTSSTRASRASRPSSPLGDVETAVAGDGNCFFVGACVAALLWASRDEHSFRVMADRVGIVLHTPGFWSLPKSLQVRRTTTRQTLRMAGWRRHMLPGSPTVLRTTAHVRQCLPLGGCRM